MSQVFEALRKSEAERSGTEEVTPLAATELLKRVERSAAAQRKTEAGTVDLADQLQDEFPLPLHSGELPADSSAPEIFTSAEPAQDTAPAAVFGVFESLRISMPADSRLVSVVDMDSPAAEAFRLLAVRLRHLRRERPLKKVLITSTLPEEGKSFSSANLACALALNAQERILLIEGDVRHPSLWQIFGVAKMPGLCEYMRDGRSLSSCVYRLDTAGIWFLPAGSAQGDPLEIIQSPKMNLAMGQLAQWFDWIVIDSPPALPLADTTTLARLVDGILLVTRRGTTRKRKLQKGMDTLEPEKLIGVLLNSSDGASDSDYYYYHDDSAKPRKKPANAT
jgi:capsular exopolysaccharide synthesis family protein